MRYALKNHSPRFVFKLGFDKLIPGVFCRYRHFGVYQLKVPEDSQLTEPASPINVARIESASELEQLGAITGVPANVLSDDTICIAAEDHSELVGGFYLKPKSFVEDELGVRIDLPENAFWMYSAAVSKSRRRQGVYKALQQRFRKIAGLETAPIYYSIDLYNRPSLNAHRHLSTDCLGKVFVWRTFGLVAARLKSENETSGRLQLSRRFTTSANRDPIVIKIKF